MIGKIALLASLFTAGTAAAATNYGWDKKQQALRSLKGPPGYKVHGSLISVIIPAFREEDYLEPLLVSISNQTYEPLETIISDSSPPESKQKTYSLVRAWQPAMTLRMVDSPPKNVSAGRNAGAAAARGKALMFIDADCIMEPQYCEKLAYNLAGGAVLAHGMDCWYDNDVHNTLKSFYSWVKPRLHTTGRGVLIRKADFDAVGGYRTDLDPAVSTAREDLDLGARVEQMFGTGAVQLNRDAVVAESDRRPIFSSSSRKVWVDRGWRKGRAVNYNNSKYPDI